jgi:predicted DNA-binding transcriptional regulator YafY
VKSIKMLAKLKRIIGLLEDPAFIATQSAIATELGCSERQIRNYFSDLSDLGAPLSIDGRFYGDPMEGSNSRAGWELLRKWNFDTAILTAIDEELDD